MLEVWRSVLLLMTNGCLILGVAQESPKSPSYSDYQAIPILSSPAPSYSDYQAIPIPSSPALSYSDYQAIPILSSPAPSYSDYQAIPIPSSPAPSYSDYQAIFISSSPAPSYSDYQAIFNPSYPAPSYPAQSYPAPTYPAPGYFGPSTPPNGYVNPGNSNNIEAICPELRDKEHATTLVCQTVIEQECDWYDSPDGNKRFCDKRERKNCFHSLSPSLAISLDNLYDQKANRFIQYVCESGYESRDMPNLRCQSNGTWDYNITNLPSCIDTNECLNSPCDSAIEQCFNTAGSYECRCNPCGKNARRSVPKQDQVNGRNCECSCDEGFIGDPFTSCSRPECMFNNDCDKDLACRVDYTCYNPCLGTCGANTTCDVKDHRPLCSCLPNHVGHPYGTNCGLKKDYSDPCAANPCGQGEVSQKTFGLIIPTGEDNGLEWGGFCTCLCPYSNSTTAVPGEACVPQCSVDSDCPPHLACIQAQCIDPCHESQSLGNCGYNAECHVRNHSPTCSCPYKYKGNSLVECKYDYDANIPEEDITAPCNISKMTDCDIISKCLQSSQGYIGELTTNCTMPQCLVNTDCGNTEACGNDYKCYDPCSNTCANNATCQVDGHRPICTCLQNYLGDPYHSNLGTCALKKNYTDPCDPNPCGKGSNPVRTVVPEISICKCACPYDTDGYLDHGLPCQPECAVQSDCPPHEDCFENRCIDPCYQIVCPPNDYCYVKGDCPANEKCFVINHHPTCFNPDVEIDEPEEEEFYIQAFQYEEPEYEEPEYEEVHERPSEITTDIQQLEGCVLQWEDDAQEKVTFTNKDDKNEGVLATLWVEPSAFECGLTLEDLAHLQFDMNQSETVQSDVEDTNSTEVPKDSGTKPKTKEELAVLKKTAHNGGTVLLQRWRAYSISVTARWSLKEATRSFVHDTFQWSCQDEGKTSISQRQFCNGHPDCPNAKDEEETVCKVSELSKRLSIVLSFPIMIAIIFGYFMLPKLQANSKVMKKIKANIAMAMDDKGLAESKNKFISSYKAAHSSSSGMIKKVEEVKFEFSRLPSLDQQTELCRWVQEVEEELHPDPGERYQCVLGNYRACHPLAGRIADPSGGIMLKVASRVNVNIVWMFLLLCLHIFDYVKDIDISTVIYHFDKVVLQQAYRQYNNFNFFYLFLTSIGLLCVTHIFNVTYWVLARNTKETKVLRNRYGETRIGQALYRHLPLLPALLPIITFCQLAELSLALGTPVEPERWFEMMQEKVLLERMANDIKMIESVNEVFGQLVIQSLLLIKFTWLLKIDNVKLKFLGISFQTYMVITMIISFVSMLPAVLKYHKRNRENLRPLTSIATMVILMVWISVILTKVAVYILGFQNTPGLLFVPITIHMTMSFTLLSRLEPQFEGMQPHDQLVYVLVSSLVPVSIPCQQSKDMRRGYGLSLLLFAAENISILIFAIIMKNLSGYRKSFEEFPKLIKIDHIVDNFDLLCALMMLLVLVVTALSAALLVLYAKYHPSNKLFKSQKSMSNDPEAETAKEATSPKLTNIEVEDEVFEKGKYIPE